MVLFYNVLVSSVHADAAHDLGTWVAWTHMMQSAEWQ